MCKIKCVSCKKQFGLRKFKEVDSSELAPVRALLIEFSEVCDVTKRCESGEELMNVVDKISSITKDIYKIITKIHLNDLKTFGETSYE